MPDARTTRILRPAMTLGSLLLVGLLGPGCPPLADPGPSRGGPFDPNCGEVEDFDSDCERASFLQCTRLREEDERLEVWWEADSYESAEYRCIADSANIALTPECCDAVELFHTEYRGCTDVDPEDCSSNDRR